jgi:hypothetical protein
MNTWRLAVLISGALVTTLAAQSPASEAVARLNQARAAMGGAAELAAVKTLRLVVHDRDRMGTWFPDKAKGPVFHEARSEMRAMFPDSYLVAAASMSQAFGPPNRRWGFNGPDDPRASPTSRAILGHLMLALLLRMDTVFPFVLKGATGQTITFADPYGDELLMDLDSATNLPARIRYVEVIRDRDAQPTGQARPRRVELGNYASVGRLRLPRSRTTFQDEILLQERRFEVIEINPTLTPADFK